MSKDFLILVAASGTFALLVATLIVAGTLRDDQLVGQPKLVADTFSSPTVPGKAGQGDK